MDDADDGGPDPVDRVLAAIGLRLEEARSLLDDASTRWRGDALRLSEGTRQRLGDLFRDIGLVTREDWDELELRVAQLQHRLRLLEDRDGTSQGEDTSWPSRPPQ